MWWLGSSRIRSSRVPFIEGSDNSDLPRVDVLKGLHVVAQLIEHPLIEDPFIEDQWFRHHRICLSRIR